jgi:anti-sigma regulatory factor (Ser/Thr protein kinase)
MEIKQNFKVSIQDRSEIAEARRIILEMAGYLGFDENESSNIAIVATELATNLFKHAKEGQILVQIIEDKGTPVGIDLIALDHGPGIPNLPEAMRDGYSTHGSSGTGLGAINRLSVEFDAYSQPNQGSAILARFWLRDKKNSEGCVAVVNIPKLEEKVSGDGWSYSFNNSTKTFLVVDGLGHGILAAEASRRAVQIFQQNSHEIPVEILEAMHDGLRSTRGAAAAIAQVDLSKKLIHYAGVGNINGAIVTPSTCKRMVSHNGTLGHEIWKINEFSYEIPDGAALLMHSDGLGSQWDIRKYPGLLSHHPQIVTSILYRDFHKDRDDVTVLFSMLGSSAA